MLSPCTLLQLYCWTNVVNVHAGHSEKGGNSTNVQGIVGKFIAVCTSGALLDKKQETS